jgi:hypothetical protein
MIVEMLGTVPNGLGKDIWTLSPTQITHFLYYFWVLAWIYFLEVVLTKLSIQFFFLRVFPSQLAQRLLWGTVIFTALWGIAFVTTCWGQCRPISYVWTNWDGLHEGKCIHVAAFTWTHAVINICIDIWMLAVPLWQISSLQMSLKKKIGVGLMFFVGTFVTVISIVRLYALVIFSRSSNLTYDYFDVSIWSSVEVTVGIICTCMPTIRQALAKIFPRVMGGSSANTRRKTDYITGSRSAGAGGDSHTGWRKRFLSSNNRPRDGSDPHHGYRLEGPNAGSMHVVVQGGHVRLSNSGKGRAMMGRASPEKGHFKDDSRITVLQERTVHAMGDLESDSVYGDGDGTSRSSDRGDEATLVELKNLSPKSPR